MVEPTVRQQAVDALARQVVAGVSPAELPLFRATAARYHADPTGTVAAKPKTDETLGFGADAAVLLITPYALDLVKRLFTRVVEKVGDGAADSLAARIVKLFGGGPDKDQKDQKDQKGDDAAPLSADQLRLVADTARAEAGQLALPADQADRLADAVVAALATRT
jgi:hypothetical protein